MLSTSQTHACPGCGLPAVVRTHTTRHRHGGERYGFETQLTFACRRGCRLTAEQIRALCGFERCAVDAPPAQAAC